ncbi:tyrosine-type recombinase/integrase [Butyrivibrio sp. WCE2006]|uniref:tyrosine-type recombinase/integrase n=1 Tax=Butyrivibrio sp. WCE2006 TaxID=1410611 RepID=UPI0005D28813|nr:tyrosine-type recombinase/integrase [Butyrivibrio sp. WCE2006]
MANNIVNYSDRINELLDKMPDFVTDFIFNFRDSDNPSTMLQYSRDIYDFLSFLVYNHAEFDGTDIKDISLEDLSKLKALDINRYLTRIRSTRDRRYKKVRTDIKEKNEVPQKHNDSTVRRLRATLSSMFSYFITNGKLTANPAAATRQKKLAEKKLIYLTNEQQAMLLDEVRTGENLEGKAARHHDRFVLRDLAMILLLLDTGLRVSEMLSTDIGDYNFDDCNVLVMRKGGDQDIVYYSDECAACLQEYFSAQLTKYDMDSDHIPAFTTLKGERLGVRAVEILVKKYAIAGLGSTLGQTITPHKLRSSFAMSFYAASDKDILLLKEKLHHSSINTTNIYAKAAPGKKADTRNLLQGLR